MESESCKSPDVEDRNPCVSGQKKSFLTPCRRLGLSRRSPMMIGGLHKATVTPTRSLDSSPVLKSPEPSPSASTSRTVVSDSHSSFMNTPSRCGLSRVRTRNLYKRLKSNHPQQQLSAINHPTPGQSESSSKPESDGAEEFPKDEDSEGEASGTNIKYKVKDGKLNGQEITVEMIQEVKARIKEKEERIRHLEQMKIYRKKHDPDVLRRLIECWREGCQKALQALATELHARGRGLSIEELLRQLRIPFELVKYNPDEEEFQ